jgi:hypothetical protein
MMAGRKVSDVRRVSGKEFREIESLPWVRDEALSDRSFEARVLPDGRVLMVFLFSSRKQGNLFPSRAAVEEMIREAKEAVAKGPIDYTKTLLPPLDDFLRDAEVHAKGLGKALGIPEEALDRSLESLDVAFKAVVRRRRDKRLTPEIFTPLTAYTGEVMRLACDGRWTKMPATRKRKVPVFDPEHEARWQAAAGQATLEVRARGGSHAEVQQAIDNVHVPRPVPIRWDVVEEPLRGHENEPVIQARDGAFLQPFAAVLKEVVEHSARGSLTGAVAGRLVRYPAAKRGRSSDAG